VNGGEIMAQQIEDILRSVPEGQRQLAFNFDHRDGGYVARAMLTLPTGNLLARTLTPVADHREAVDQVVDNLAAEVRRHRERLRTDAVKDRNRRRRREFAVAQPNLAALRRENDREAFFETLRPLMRQLRNHARRELTIAQLEGTIKQNDLAVGDVLDEVMLRAWDRWNERPRDEPLDRWLVRLMHEVLDERGLETPDGEEEDDAPAAGINHDPRYEVDDGWATENNPYWPFGDSLTLDDVLTAVESPVPVEELTAVEERRMILRELRRLPRDQRRAFVLHAIEGWSLEDIARFQGRSADEVRADVEAARRTLRERLGNLLAQQQQRGNHHVSQTEQTRA
jgi:RNA polymerase sigma factor (sigma-70 family)